MNILEGPLVIVDIETNGLSYARGRIIEIAAIRVENGQITDTFSTLLNPYSDIPSFISNLTGITKEDVADSPSFSDVAGELYDFMDGAVFVAHSVRFDYSFVKQEFKRVGRKFNPKLLCSVKLSKTLYPEHRSHKLESIIDRHNIKVNVRHRAYDDAHAVWQFLQIAQNTFSAKVINAALARQLKMPTLPKGLSPEIIHSMHDSHGVYIFQAEDGSPLYIGKSINVRARVLSHFRSDHEIETEFKIAQSIANIEVRPTLGELEALLLESQLIKDMQPLYNRKLRRNQKLTLAKQHLDNQGYINIQLEDSVTIEPTETEDILAVYSTRGQAKKYLDMAVKDSLLCPKLLGLEKSKSSCFLYQLRKCEGACAGKEPVHKYNSRLLDYFKEKRIEQWPYQSPVLIEEKNYESDTLKSIVVDQWCIIADISQEEHCEPVIKARGKAFDLDTYKILHSYLRDKVHKLNIKPIAPNQLKDLVA